MKGTYVLALQLKKDSRIKIGKLGILGFPKGNYCYVGSAFGKTVNLENRIKRHKKLNKSKKGKLKWHIDYFLTNPNVSVKKTFVFNNKKIECKTSQMLERNAKMSVKKFGCSDCKCKSHFHYFNNKNYEKLLTG
ncbi:unnamed protein product [marine sediment metagenome]|uniref:GIY-YIG domain-containing protein n=1 Tax=marine sediment metagenome TaxID=412755 RepID=X1FIF2_9ZZZZ